MFPSQPPNSDYVLSVRDDTQKYIRNLLAEMHRLRGLVERALAEVHHLSEENAELTARLGAQKRELTQFRSEREQLAERLAATAHQREALQRDSAEIEQRNDDLANLYVATYRLHGTFDEQAVLTAIEEIVIDLIGCEQLGVFELDEASGEMGLIRSFGLPPHVGCALDAASGVLGRAVRAGEVILPDAAVEPLSEHERGLTACVPLNVGRRICGAILLFELLPQKRGCLAPIDVELLALLKSQAGAALHASRVLCRSGVAAS